MFAGRDAVSRLRVADVERWHCPHGPGRGGGDGHPPPTLGAAGRVGPGHPLGNYRFFIGSEPEPKRDGEDSSPTPARAAALEARLFDEQVARVHLERRLAQPGHRSSFDLAYTFPG